MKVILSSPTDFIAEPDVVLLDRRATFGSHDVRVANVRVVKARLAAAHNETRLRAPRRDR